MIEWLTGFDDDASPSRFIPGCCAAVSELPDELTEAYPGRTGFPFVYDADNDEIVVFVS